jgi:hypothetical protein
MAVREHVQLVHGPNCGCIRHRQERAEAAAKAHPQRIESKKMSNAFDIAQRFAPTIKPEPKLETAVKMERKAERLAQATSGASTDQQAPRRGRGAGRPFTKATAASAAVASAAPRARGCRTSRSMVSEAVSIGLHELATMKQRSYESAEGTLSRAFRVAVHVSA